MPPPFAKPNLKPTTCLGCNLYHAGEGWVPRDGGASSGVLLVGDTPGETEARSGKPFVGAAGFYLDRLLRRAGLDRKTFALHNVLSCKPPIGWAWDQSAISHCAPNLDKTIRDQAPKVVVAFGDMALRRLVPSVSGIHRHRGFVLKDRDGRFVVPTFHPSYLLPRPGQVNTSRFVGAVIRDLRRALQIARDGFTRIPTSYLEDPKPDEFAMWIIEFEQAFRKDPDLFLSFDIETPYKLKNKNEDEITDDDSEDSESELPLAEPILRISFSYRAGTAVTVPWSGEYLAGIKQLLQSPVRKTVWNGVRFDVPVIESHGITVAGRVYDFMWGFHLWQSDLPKSLEFVSSLLTDLEPWKHLSDSRPAFYNAVDADAQLRCGQVLKQELIASGQWEIFERHMVDLDPLLMAMGKRGVLIDREAQNSLKEELLGEQQTLTDQAQTLVPREVLPRTRYKTKPDCCERDFAADLSAGDQPTTHQLERLDVIYELGSVKSCTSCGLVASNKSSHFKGGKTNPCKVANGTIELRRAWIPRYDVLDPFNPNSVQHLIAYAKHFNHPIPLHHRTKRETFDKKTVQRLVKTKGAKHPIYGIALKLRGVRKTLGTYVEGFKPDSQGLIHTTFGHHPSSLRLSARNVNTTNISHRGGVAYADRVRRTIIPRPGMVFVEADSSAIEAVMTGYFMGSEKYTALAKEGIHDYLTCLEHEMEFNVEGILRSKGEFKNDRDRNKIVVHGTSYGMTPYLMHMSWPEIFPTVAMAEAAQQHFFNACPGLKEWQHEVRTRAHKQTYLENPWRYRHYFYDVFTKDKYGVVQDGSDANRCVSFLPQSSAAAFLKDNVILLSKTKWWPMPAIGVIHDSYCLEVPEADADAAVEVLVHTLTRPIPEMNNLTVGCEVKVSMRDASGARHWDSMQTVRKAA